ncbi:MAG: hypothetical protein CMO74_11895 [Verrucomicrobiales bacterium]|nr:hypothetical protein [Verrucomicrobiales bacterium]
MCSLMAGCGRDQFRSPFIKSIFMTEMSRPMNGWKRVLEFFIGPVFVRPLCFFRIGAGLLIAWQGFHWLPDATELFSNEGFQIQYRTRLFEWGHLAPSPASAKAICCGLAMGGIALAAGLLTKLALVGVMMVWTFLAGLEHVAYKELMMVWHLILILLLFTPCGRFYSMDSWLRDRWKPDKANPEEMMPGLMFRMLQVVFLQYYFFPGLVKFMEPTWRNGTALASTMVCRMATDFGLWIASWMPMFGYVVLSLGIIFYEVTAAWGLTSRRWLGWYVLAGLTFHIGIQLTLDLDVGTLGPIFMLALVCLFAIPGGLIWPRHFLPKSTGDKFAL